MGIKSYLSPKTKIRTSKIHGNGLFAIKPIRKNEIVAIKGGSVFNKEILDKIEQDNKVAREVLAVDKWSLTAEPNPAKIIKE